MPTEKEVYAAHAGQYERLVRREDYQNNLLAAIETYSPLDGLDVVELGAGTGRLTRLLASYVRSIKAFDSSAHMLEAAETALRETGHTNWETGVADHRQVPGSTMKAQTWSSRVGAFVTLQSGVARIGNPR